MSRPHVVIVNPLARALDHYVASLASTLRESGATVEIRESTEPSQSSRGRFAWLAHHVRDLRSAARAVARRPQASVIVVWPVLGYLEFPAVRLVCGRATVRVVMHDPRPLVRNLGHSPLMRCVGTLCMREGAILVHSDEARRDLPGRRARRVALSVPMAPSPPRAGAESMSAAAEPRPVIRVIGQYKPERDLTLLSEVASRCPGDFVFEIAGRGWPEVAGWRVREGFLSRLDLERLVRTSSIVLIPYRRFYQSDIAVHCLESGVPFVGPRVGCLEGLLPDGAPALVPCESLDDADAWNRAIESALVGDVDLVQQCQSVRQRCVDEWRRLLADECSAAHSR